ncbi:MAG: helix-turn-helix domain-containing protein [Halodesulfovibrio sp.]
MGRKPSADREPITAMLEAGKSHAVIAKELGCSTKTVQRMKHV